MPVVISRRTNNLGANQRGGRNPVESVATFAWNRWSRSRGISGRFRVERVVGLPWNTQVWYEISSSVDPFAHQNRVDGPAAATSSS